VPGIGLSEAEEAEEAAGARKNAFLKRASRIKQVWIEGGPVQPGLAEKFGNRSSPHATVFLIDITVISAIPFLL